MDRAPALTIGLPVYNGARYLESAIQSILDQSFDDFELIVSDNASTDDTEAIGRRLAAGDPRVIYRRNDVNVGLRANFNLLVGLARGGLFKWAAADDTLRPGYLERCVAVLEADPRVVLVYAKTEFIDGSGARLDLDDPGWPLASDDAAERLAYAVTADHFVNSMLGVIRTDALKRTRLLPPYHGGDYRLMAELALLGTFAEIQDRLLVRRIHEASSKGNAEDAAWMRRYWSGGHSGPRAAYWRLVRDNAAIVLRAPIPAARKAALLARLARTMIANWRRLARELGELVRA